jgi:hypothetical protein
MMISMMLSRADTSAQAHQRNLPGELAMIKTVAGRGRGMDERRERGKGCEGGGGGGYIGSG